MRRILFVAYLFFSLPTAAADKSPLKDAVKAIKAIYTRCSEPKLPKELVGEKQLDADVKSADVAAPSGKVDVKYRFTDSKTVVMYFHGSGETVDDMQKFFQFFNTKGVGLVVFDYPCFGKSEGAPTEKSVGEAGLAVLKWLKNQKPDSRVVLWGQSLGAAAVLQTYKLSQSDVSLKVDKLAILSPWDTLENSCLFITYGGVFGVCESEKFKDNEYRNIEIAPTIKTPTTVIYSEGDEKIPAKESAMIAQAIQGAQTVVLDKSQKHIDLTAPANFEKAMNAVLDGLH